MTEPLRPWPAGLPPGTLGSQMREIPDTRDHRDREGTRATIILGFASIGAGLGAAVGGITMIAMHPGYIPDYPPYSAAGVVAGAGGGWSILGALAGTAASQGGHTVRGSIATVLRVVAGVAIVAAVVLWDYWESFLQTRVLIEGELLPLQLATLGSAVGVAVTLVGASFAAPSHERDAPGLVARLMAVVGIIVLAALFVGILSITSPSRSCSTRGCSAPRQPSRAYSGTRTRCVRSSAASLPPAGS